MLLHQPSWGGFNAAVEVLRVAADVAVDGMRSAAATAVECVRIGAGVFWRFGQKHTVVIVRVLIVIVEEVWVKKWFPFLHSVGGPGASSSKLPDPKE